MRQLYLISMSATIVAMSCTAYAGGGGSDSATGDMIAKVFWAAASKLASMLFGIGE